MLTPQYSRGEVFSQDLVGADWWGGPHLYTPQKLYYKIFIGFYHNKKF
jgi:hypothetical protein